MGSTSMMKARYSNTSPQWTAVQRVLMNMAEFTGALNFVNYTSCSWCLLCICLCWCFYIGCMQCSHPTQVQVWLQAVLESPEGGLWLQRVRLISPHLLSARPLLNRCWHTFSAHLLNSDQCSHISWPIGSHNNAHGLAQVRVAHAHWPRQT